MESYLAVGKRWRRFSPAFVSEAVSVPNPLAGEQSDSVREAEYPGIIKRYRPPNEIDADRRCHSEADGDHILACVPSCLALEASFSPLPKDTIPEKSGAFGENFCGG